MSGRVYGRNGNLQKLLLLNPQIPNPHFVLSGTIVNLPDGAYRNGNESCEQLTLNPSVDENPILVKDAPPISRNIAETSNEDSAESNSQAYPSQLETTTERSALSTETPSEKSAEKTSEPSANQKLNQPNEQPVHAEAESASPTLLSHGAGQISLLGGLKYTRWDARDVSNGATATLLSDTIISAQAEWRQVWSPQWQSRVNFHMDRVKILQSSSSKKISNLEETTTGFEFSLERRFQRNRWIALTGWQEELSVKALSTSEISIEKISHPFLQFGHRYDLHCLEPFCVYSIADVAYLFPATSSTSSGQAGTSLNLGFGLNQKFQRGSLASELSYSQSKYQTGIAETVKSEIRALIIYSWELQP